MSGLCLGYANQVAVEEVEEDRLPIHPRAYPASCALCGVIVHDLPCQSGSVATKCGGLQVVLFVQGGPFRS